MFKYLTVQGERNQDSQAASLAMIEHMAQVRSGGKTSLLRMD
jgi:hypothetical protein